MLRFSKCLLCPVFSASHRTGRRTNPANHPESRITATAQFRHNPPRRYTARHRRRSRHRQPSGAGPQPQGLRLHPPRKKPPPADQKLRRAHGPPSRRSHQIPPHARYASGHLHQLHPGSRNGVVNVLLLDTLNTPMKDQTYVRQQLRKYLKNAGPAEPASQSSASPAASSSCRDSPRPCSAQGAQSNRKTRGPPRCSTTPLAAAASETVSDDHEQTWTIP